ncbi:hypothetical protein ZEAMMB73_Zm00001d011609 [Zea mays]|uniref:Uncharacterized protein n=1 Tax=Zea mays TaxID=4577 RepID=A0A1D6G251_MAIZE|nr:hypothetical protein ZEAMMB73_Zm00001d011609 [Zea mays]AQK97481.1 hypothetical protein ZEAMMB73_Zm00001d011609 [Zea mays]
MEAPCACCGSLKVKLDERMKLDLLRFIDILVDNNNLSGPLPPELVDTCSLLAILTSG